MVPAGLGDVSRLISPANAEARGESIVIEVQPDRATAATLGGGGRPVTGRFTQAPKPQPGVPGRPPYIELRPVPWEWQKLGTRAYADFVDGQKAFRMEDVLPGAYTLFADDFLRQRITITVPAAPSDRPDEPYDLGALDQIERATKRGTGAVP
jgi:hypothetical protein